MGEGVPTLQPINTSAIISHWRPLAFLWDSLSSQQREAVGQIDNEPCPPAPAHSGPVPEVEMAEPGPPTPAMPLEPSLTGPASTTTAPHEPSLTGPVDDPNPIEQIARFDAHFHPDRLQTAASGQSRKQDGATQWSLAMSRTTCFPLRVVLLTTVTRTSSLVLVSRKKSSARSEARIGKWLSESIPKERRITRL